LTDTTRKIALTTLFAGGIVWILNTSIRAFALSFPKILILSISGWIDFISCSVQSISLIFLLNDMKTDHTTAKLSAIIFRAFMLTLGILLLEVVSFALDFQKLGEVLTVLPFKLYLLLLPIFMYQYSLVMAKDFGSMISSKGK
jgi:hypothetical protein